MKALTPEGREAVEANLNLAQRAIERARTVVEDEQVGGVLAALLAQLKRGVEEARSAARRLAMQAAGLEDRGRVDE